jgi:hypothetical protein
METTRRCRENNRKMVGAASFTFLRARETNRLVRLG